MVIEESINCLHTSALMYAFADFHKLVAFDHWESLLERLKRGSAAHCRVLLFKPKRLAGAADTLPWPLGKGFRLWLVGVHGVTCCRAFPMGVDWHVATNCATGKTQFVATKRNDVELEGVGICL
jgi:hypothetical protein